MSEYQYYEFQAIDRPLSDEDRRALRGLSTRARITATSFTNDYQWGDFKGSPVRLMERWFDLHLYLANWGTRRVMIRLPQRLVARSHLDRFLRCVDLVRVRESGDNLIVDVHSDDDDTDYSDYSYEEDDTDCLAAIAPLRAAVLAGDWRLFYLLWLTAVVDERLDDGDTEPLPGIGPLTGALKAFADLFGIDPHLLQAAAESPLHANGELSADEVRAVVAAIPDTEKTALLCRLVSGDPHVAAEVSGKVRAGRGHHGRLGYRPPDGRRAAHARNGDSRAGRGCRGGTDRGRAATPRASGRAGAPSTPHGPQTAGRGSLA